MWTDTTPAQYARADLALPSDLNDGEWALLEPFFPLPSHVGRPRKWSLRRIVEAILYLLRGGLPWRMWSQVSRRIELIASSRRPQRPGSDGGGPVVVAGKGNRSRIFTRIDLRVVAEWSVKGQMHRAAARCRPCPDVGWPEPCLHCRNLSRVGLLAASYLP